MAKHTLSEKEKQFCYYIANRRSIKEAARLSGYVNPLITGLKLCLTPSVKEYVDKLRTTSKGDNEAYEGLRAIAFGDVTDAVRLATAKEIDSLDIGALDLQMVSELKFSKNGGIEIKFYDRIKALERLMEVSNTETTGSDFFKALQDSVHRLYETEA